MTSACFSKQIDCSFVLCHSEGGLHAVCLELEPSLGSTGGAASIVFSSYRPNRFTLEAQVETTGLFVLSEVYYPGWRATVNGKEAHVYKVDGVLRGVVVPPGRNIVRMEYKPRCLPIGVGLSVLALLATIGLGLFWFTRKLRVGRNW